jgi:3-deoxy-manno-octulosonate cytidylyltransferase (CMP-KDO synthetase)
MIPGNKHGVPDPRHEYLLHLGLQVYDAAFLKVYSRLPATPCQLQEDLEQLKVLEHGYKMKTVKVAHAAHGVDEPADVASIEAILARQDARA